MRVSRSLLGGLARGARGVHSTVNPRISLAERLFGTGEVFKHDLYKPPPYAPEPVIEDIPKPDAVKLTELKNGVRVATQDLGGQVSALAIFVDGVSRCENPITSGASFVLSKLAFKGSVNRTRVEMLRDMEELTADFSCAASRECFASSAEGWRLRAPDMLRTIIEATVYPRVLCQPGTPEFDSVRIEMGKMMQLVEQDIKDMPGKEELAITAALHDAAYNGDSIGLPVELDENRFHPPPPEYLRTFVESFFTGKNIVISATNVDHDEMVKVTEDMLKSLPAGEKNVKRHPAHYTGGERRIRMDNTAQVSLGFEGHPWGSDETAAQSILQIMMGGGGSFSAGGPGKGTCTRLYSNVIHQYHNIHSANAVNHWYSDTSLFAINASADPQTLNDTLQVVSDSATSMAKAPSAQELSRAKNQTKATMLNTMESHYSLCEDIGRQVLNSDKYISPDEFLDRIDKTTAKDIQSVGEKLLSSKPTLVIRGELYNTPTFDKLSNNIAKGVKSISS
mmetsp:Transcript_1162/g.3597  ORF Transcript_1162/g.3597 Transcript_1162/m.3597 type:complete len:508 (+) Transcript_1162:83-1606(+)